MSDNEEVETERAPVEPAGQAYKIVFLKVDETGAPALLKSAQVLPAKVYDRRTAIKYAAFEAQRLSTTSLTERLVAVVSPNGRCIAVLAGGTGKPVRPLIAMRTKRALATLLPSDVKVRRRTSRSLSVSRPARLKRRTSRR
jgi:hypothetical protein